METIPIPSKNVTNYNALGPGSKYGLLTSYESPYSMDLRYVHVTLVPP